jgi:UDP-N-acetylmuramoylalanine--D-glutamate ligase
VYLILGVGISNIAVIKKLSELNKKMVVACNESEIVKVSEYCKSIILYEDIKYLNLSRIKYVIKSPGIPYHNKYVIYLKRNGKTILNEIELTYLLSKRKGKYIGVTGSVGKSSVVSLLYSLIKCNNDNVILAGNIGVPLITYLDQINKDTIIILEVSSFQLDDFNNMRFNIALLLNIYDNHLDVYKNKTRYYLSKLSIGKNQLPKDYFITNLNNTLINKYIDKEKINAHIIDYNNEYYVWNNDLYYKKERVLSLDNYCLKGKGNLENLEAVITILNILKVNLDIKELRRFKPLKYHLEEMTFNNITFINDSKSTSTSSLKLALDTYLSKNLILVFGGHNKNLDFEFLNDYTLKKSICFGTLSSEIKNKVIIDASFNNLKTALDYIFCIAKSGDIILFSPGCASFDEFDNYMQRGEFFNNYIKEHYGK